MSQHSSHHCNLQMRRPCDIPYIASLLFELLHVHELYTIEPVLFVYFDV